MATTKNAKVKTQGATALIETAPVATHVWAAWKQHLAKHSVRQLNRVFMYLMVIGDYTEAINDGVGEMPDTREGRLDRADDIISIGVAVPTFGPSGVAKHLAKLVDCVLLGWLDPINVSGPGWTIHVEKKVAYDSGYDSIKAAAPKQRLGGPLTPETMERRRAAGVSAYPGAVAPSGGSKPAMTVGPHVRAKIEQRAKAARKGGK